MTTIEATMVSCDPGPPDMNESPSDMGSAFTEVGTAKMTSGEMASAETAATKVTAAAKMAAASMATTTDRSTSCGGDACGYTDY